MYLLDTDIISALMKSNAPEILTQKLASIASHKLATSAISVGEVYFGACLTQNPERFLKPFEAILERLRVFDFNIQAAKAYGELKARLKRKGQPLDEPDLRIASICLANQLTLVTANTRHFSRIEKLLIQNWLQP